MSNNFRTLSPANLDAVAALDPAPRAKVVARTIKADADRTASTAAMVAPQVADLLTEVGKHEEGGPSYQWPTARALAADLGIGESYVRSYWGRLATALEQGVDPSGQTWRDLVSGGKIRGAKFKSTDGWTEQDYADALAAKAPAKPKPAPKPEPETDETPDETPEQTTGGRAPQVQDFDVRKDPVDLINVLTMNVLGEKYDRATLAAMADAVAELSAALMTDEVAEAIAMVA